MLSVQRHKQEIYEVLTIYYDGKKLGKTSFVLRLKTLKQLSEQKIKLHEAINRIFETEYFKKCKSEQDISKYKKQIRKEYVDILKKLDVDVKYNELTSTRSKKYQEYMNNKMQEFDKKRIKDENFTNLVKALRSNNLYLERDMFNAVLMTLNNMSIKKHSLTEAVNYAVNHFKVDEAEVKKHVDMVKGK